MNYDKVYNEFTKTSDIVKDVLVKHPNTRDDDFVLYAWVLYHKGINLNQSLRDFLATASKSDAPAFATITKCRRTLQGIYPQLKGKSYDRRQEMQMVYKTYNQENN